MRSHACLTRETVFVTDVSPHTELVRASYDDHREHQIITEAMTMLECRMTVGIVMPDCRERPPGFPRLR